MGLWVLVVLPPIYPAHRTVVEISTLVAVVPVEVHPLPSEGQLMFLLGKESVCMVGARSSKLVFSMRKTYRITSVAYLPFR
jgi:hypothetical protein